MFGILNFNKPAGWTSRDVVNRVQRLVRPVKVGHAGTLDPLATGVLVVCVGPATRLVEHVQRMPKSYRAQFLLGVTSESDDTELQLNPVPGATIPTREAIDLALPAFVGQIMQRPPAYSAVKLQGKKAYKLARQGETVEIAPRPVTIHSVDVVRFDYPKLELEIECGSGTYIRSLGRDLAESLGTGAVMSGLVRTAIGEFAIDNAISPVDLTSERIAAHIQPAKLAVASLPHIELTPEELDAICHGRTFSRDLKPVEELASLDATGELVAILKPKGEGVWGPKMVFRRGD